MLQNARITIRAWKALPSSWCWNNYDPHVAYDSGVTVCRGAAGRRKRERQLSFKSSQTLEAIDPLAVTGLMNGFNLKDIDAKEMPARARRTCHEKTERAGDQWGPIWGKRGNRLDRNTQQRINALKATSQLAGQYGPCCNSIRRSPRARSSLRTYAGSQYVP
ncbi:hypothetical protein [Paraburkholderia sp. HD33-4]|uniref:hypothetical protein n=1 Tax=Paraburkholderia sp. HD33-4 TaxID=2883242 RepID=UPI001F1978C3|nr:hypothetical protein [Paraburkholderia sp. HD33-4]